MNNDAKKQLTFSLLLLVSGIFGNVIFISFIMYLLKTLGLLVCSTVFIISLVLISIFKMFDKDNNKKIDIKKMVENIEEKKNKTIHFSEIPVIKHKENQVHVANLRCLNCNKTIKIYDDGESDEVCECGISYKYIVNGNTVLFSMNKDGDDFSFLIENITKTYNKDKTDG